MPVPAKTFTQYLLGSDGNYRYEHILSGIAVSVKVISGMISRGSLVRDPRIKLATNLLMDRLSGIEQLAAVSIAGEKAFRPVSVNDDARYLLLVEALHGSIDPGANETVGMTFSIMTRTNRGKSFTTQEFFQPGNTQICAGMALFGPSTVMLVTMGDGVDEFTLDRDVGNFVLTRSNISIVSEATTYAIDAGKSLRWEAPVKRYVEECVEGREGVRRQDFTMRWNPSPVIGASRILRSGGLFMLPRLLGTQEPWGASLMHTAAPIAWICEQAGGAATTGTSRVLDVVPKHLGDRVPMFFGSKLEVDRVVEYFDQHARGLDVDAEYPLFHGRTLFVDEV